LGNPSHEKDPVIPGGNENGTGCNAYAITGNGEGEGGGGQIREIDCRAGKRNEERGSAREGIYAKRMRECFAEWSQIATVREAMGSKADAAIRLFVRIAIFLPMYNAFGGQYEFHGALHLINLDPEGSYSLRFLDILQKTEQLA
jgi:hypothetical protein